MKYAPPGASFSHRAVLTPGNLIRLVLKTQPGHSSNIPYRFLWLALFR